MVTLNPLRSKLVICLLGLTLVIASCGKVKNPDASAESETVSGAAVNTAPVMSVIANQTVNEDTSTGDITFSITDAETAATSLTLSSATSNTTLIPSENIVLGGSGESRTINITPATDQTGSATITLQLSDGTHTTTSRFTITVAAVNDPPSLEDIATKYTTGTANVTLALSDVDNAASDLTVTAVSDNSTLVPAANISISGTSATRTLTMIVPTGQTGSATITVTVSDGTDSSSKSFQLITSPCQATSSGSIFDAATYGGDSDCGNASNPIIVKPRSWRRSNHYLF